MPDTDFTTLSVETTLGVTVGPGDVFGELLSVAPPPWLPGQLARGIRLALFSEKARSEFIVAPILLAVTEVAHNQVAIFSGERFDVDTARGLQGECDFLLTRSEPLPRVRAPLVAVVEAKKLDIEAGLGQCIAQMVAA